MYPWIRGTPTITKEFWPTHKLDSAKHIFLNLAENNIGEIGTREILCQKEQKFEIFPNVRVKWLVLS